MKFPITCGGRKIFFEKGICFFEGRHISFSCLPLHTSMCSSMHIAHFTLHTAHFTLHAAHCTLHTSHFTLHTSHCTLHTVHCTLHTAHFTLHAAHCTLHTAHFTRNSSNNHDTCFDASIQKKWYCFRNTRELFKIALRSKPTSCPGCPPIEVIILRTEQLWNLNSNFRQGRCIRIDNNQFLLTSPWQVRLSARISAPPPPLVKFYIVDFLQKTTQETLHIVKMRQQYRVLHIQTDVDCVLLISVWNT